MKNTDELLSLYREYETLMRDKGLDCKEFEDKADDATGNRLRMCRLFRNYLSHQNDPGFLEVSDTQIKFLRAQVEVLKYEDDVVKKHLKTVISGTCTEKDKCWDVLPKLNKLKLTGIIVVTSDGYGVASIHDILTSAMVSKTAKMSTVKLKKNYVVVEPTRKMRDVPVDKIVICTADGTADGKLLGVLYH